MIDNNTALNIMRKVNFNMSDDQVYRCDKYEINKDTVIVADVDEQGNFQHIGAIVQEDPNEHSDTPYRLSVATQGYKEMYKHMVLKEGDDHFIPFNGTIDYGIWKAILDQSGYLIAGPWPETERDKLLGFKSPSHPTIEIYAFSYDISDIIIQSFVNYSTSEQKYALTSLVTEDTMGDDDYGKFYDINGQILNVDQYKQYLNENN